MRFKSLLASLLLLLVFSACASPNTNNKSSEKEYADETGYSPSYRIDMEKYIKEKEKEGEVDSSIEKEDGHTVYIISSYNGKIIERIPIDDNGYPSGYSVDVSSPTSKSEDNVTNAELGIEDMSTFLNEAKLVNQPLKELFAIDTTDYSYYKIDNTHSIVINVDKKENNLNMYLGYNYFVE